MLFKRESDLMSSFEEITEIKRENNDKLYELDYMRFIACLAVMAVHISVTGVTEYINGSFPQIVMMIINRSLKFTTPVFIFLSGVTSFYSYRKKEFKYFAFLKKRLPKVLVAYFIWCIVYYKVYINLGIYTNDMNFMENVLNGTMSYHLYFVIIITQMYIVGPLFYYLLKNSDKKISILVVAAIITLLCAEFIRYELSDRLFLKYMFFYIFGIYVTLEYDKFITWINKNKVFIVAVYIITGLIYTVVSYYDMVINIYIWFVFSVASVFFVYYVGVVLKDKLKNIYSFIELFGQSSYYIYLMHPLVLTVVILYAENNGILSVTKRLLLYFFTVVPITIISCLAFTAIKNKTKKQKKAALEVNLN